MPARLALLASWSLDGSGGGKDRIVAFCSYCNDTTCFIQHLCIATLDEEGRVAGAGKLALMFPDIIKTRPQTGKDSRLGKRLYCIENEGIKLSLRFMCIRSAHSTDQTFVTLQDTP